MIEVKNTNSPIVIKERINQSDSSKFIPDEYKQVASGIEEQFLNLMLQEMNKTSKVFNEEASDSANQFYSDLLTEERAKILSSKDGGPGVQKIILDQIYPENLRNEYTYYAQKNKAEGMKNGILKYSQGKKL